jgi:hypothetical protein
VAFYLFHKAVGDGAVNNGKSRNEFSTPLEVSQRLTGIAKGAKVFCKQQNAGLC